MTTITNMFKNALLISDSDHNSEPFSFGSEEAGDIVSTQLSNIFNYEKRLFDKIEGSFFMEFFEIFNYQNMKGCINVLYVSSNYSSYSYLSEILI